MCLDPESSLSHSKRGVFYWTLVIMAAFWKPSERSGLTSNSLRIVVHWWLSAKHHLPPRNPRTDMCMHPFYFLYHHLKSYGMILYTEMHNFYFRTMSGDILSCPSLWNPTCSFMTVPPSSKQAHTLSKWRRRLFRCTFLCVSICPDCIGGYCLVSDSKLPHQLVNASYKLLVNTTQMLTLVSVNCYTAFPNHTPLPENVSCSRLNSLEKEREEESEWERFLSASTGQRVHFFSS